MADRVQHDQVHVVVGDLGYCPMELDVLDRRELDGVGGIGQLLERGAKRIEISGVARSAATPATRTSSISLTSWTFS